MDADVSIIAAVKPNRSELNPDLGKFNLIFIKHYKQLGFYYSVMKLPKQSIFNTKKNVES